MISGFKCIEFAMHFTYIFIISAPLQIIRHWILEVGTHDVYNLYGLYNTLSLEQLLLWELWVDCTFQGQWRAEKPLTWVYHTGEPTVASS